MRCPSCQGDLYHYAGCGIGEHGDMIRVEKPTSPPATGKWKPSPPAEPKCGRCGKVNCNGSVWDGDFGYRDCAPASPEPARQRWLENLGQEPAESNEFCDDCYGWSCICPATHPVICDKCGVTDMSGLTPRTASTECDPHDWQPLHIPPEPAESEGKDTMHEHFVNKVSDKLDEVTASLIEKGLLTDDLEPPTAPPASSVDAK